MEYLKINNIDYSKYVNSLKVKDAANYNIQTSASGNSVVDYINTKRTIEVGIIPLSAEVMANLQEVIKSFNVSISFLEPKTKELVTINCIIPENEVEYYTVRVDNTSFKAFKINCIEL